MAEPATTQTTQTKVPQCHAYIPRRATDDEPWTVHIQIDGENAFAAKGQHWDQTRDVACSQIDELMAALGNLRHQLQNSYEHIQLGSPASKT